MRSVAALSTRSVSFVLCIVLVADVQGAVVDHVNGEDSPAPFSFFPDQVGWVYVPTFDYTLDGVFATFAGSFGAPTRDVALSIYDEPPAAGGNLLRTALFSVDGDGGDLGALFADLELLAGEDYFIGYENIAGIGLNIVDFGVSLPPPNNEPNPAIEFLSGWYTDPGFATFNSVAASPGFSAPILRFTGVGIGPATTATWTGSDSGWTNPNNWDTFEVPNNRLGDTYNVVIHRAGFPVATTVNVSTDIEISNLDLQLGRIRLFGNSSFTVLDETTLGPPADGFSGVEPGASIVLRPLGSEQQTVDLGTLAAFSGNTLTDGGFSLTGQGAAGAVLEWQGADIHQLGANVEIYLFGPNTSIRNSVDQSDALANLQQVDGLLQIDDRGLAVSGALTINGEFMIGEAGICIGGEADCPATSVPVGLSVADDFTNRGSFVMESESTNTFFDVGGDFDNSGTAQIAFEYPWSGPDPMTATIVGHASNSGTLYFAAKGQTATLSVGGNLSNTGSIVNEGPSTSIVVAGVVAELTDGVLTDGSYETGAGVISAFGLDIQTIGADAAIVLGSRSFTFNEPGGQMLDSDAGQSALSNLEQVDGELVLNNRSIALDALTNTGVTELDTNVDATIAIAGALSNSGTIVVDASSDGGTTTASLAAAGPLLEQAGTTLTAGRYRVFADAQSEAFVAWDGAQINTIGSEATIHLSGAGAGLRDDNDHSDALAGLAINQGQLFLDDHDFSTLGDFANQSAPGEDNAILETFDSDFTVNGAMTNTGEVEITGVANTSVTGSLTNSEVFTLEAVAATLSVGGDLNNSGEMDIETRFTIAGGLSTHVTVAGSLSNSGELSLDAASSGDSVVVSAEGALAQQVGGVLTTGKLSVDAAGTSSKTATLEWTGADIQTIASDAKVTIAGVNAAIRDRSTSNNALANLANVHGAITLSEQDFVTAGDLTVSGELNVAAGDFTVAGDFTNSGTTMFSGDEALRTLQIDGTLSNTGEIHAFYAQVAAAAPLPQQVDTTLTDGFFLIQTDSIGAVVGEIAWPGAEITTIGAGGGIALIGAGSTIRDSLDNSDALVGLTESQGFFSLRLQDHAFAGDFSTAGEMELFEGVTMNFPGGAQFTNSGRLEVFGDATVVGAGVHLLDSSELLFEDSFSEISFELELGKIVANDVALDGELLVYLDLLEPEGADQYVIIDATNLTGRFDNVSNGERIDTLDGSGSFVVTYDLANHDVLLSDFAATLFPGDFDDDQDVDGADFLAWQRDFGDLYDSNDLAAWEANYGSGVPGGAIATETPEPSAALLAILGMVVLQFGICQRLGRW